MAKLSYKEAAHRLRMTVGLLKWCERYAPMKDGMKLVFTNGLIEDADLLAFDAHLRTEWPSRAVPTGIRNELRLEAAGRCGVCSNPCEHFQEAHIDRQGKEALYYYQHPHNLILLCGSCHDSYDRGSTVGNNVVRKRKDILLSRIMEDVDRDIAIAKITRDGVAEIYRVLAANAGKPDHRSTKGWIAFTDSLFAAPGTTPPDLVSTPESSELGAKLQLASDLLVLTMPVTSGTLRGSVERLEKGDPFTAPTEAEAWEFIESEPVEGECPRCSQQTPIESYTCLNCEHWGVDCHGEVPFVDREPSPPRVELEDAQGDSYQVECEKCGSKKLEFEFQPLCDYCRHVTEKDD